MKRISWKKAVKGAAIAVLALTMALSLYACTSAPSVKFENQLRVAADSIYICPSSQSTWGDPVNFASVGKGNSVHFTMERLADDGTHIFDVGVVGNNNMNYDVYEVYLEAEYTMVIRSSGDTESDSVTLTVTDTEGNERIYTGYISPNSEE